MSDINDPKYVHYPHIDKNRNLAEIDSKQRKEANSNPNDAVAQNAPHDTAANIDSSKPPVKKGSFVSTVLVIVLMLVVSAAAFIGWQWLKHDKGETHCENVDDVISSQDHIADNEPNLSFDCFTDWGKTHTYHSSRNEIVEDQ